MPGSTGHLKRFFPNLYCLFLNVYNFAKEIEFHFFAHRITSSPKHPVTNNGIESYKTKNIFQTTP